MNQDQLCEWLVKLDSLYHERFEDLSFLEQGKGKLAVPMPAEAWRFIRFELPGRQYLHLHSVDLRGVNGAKFPSSDIGIAASSHHGGSLKMLHARNVLDSEHPGRYGFHTLKERRPWLQLSLPSSIRLGEVVVRNRKDSCATRAVGLCVRGSIDGLSWTTAYDGAERIRAFHQQVLELWDRLSLGNDELVRGFFIDIMICRYEAALEKFSSEDFPEQLHLPVQDAIIDLVLKPRGLEWTEEGFRQIPKASFYSFDLSGFEKQMNSMVEFKDLLDIRKYDSSVILPLRKTDLSESNVYEGGVCDEGFNFIAGYARRKNGNEKTNNTCVRSYSPESDVEIRDEDVVFLGIHNKHFGHFLTDGMSRIYALDSIPAGVKLAYVYVPTNRRVFYPGVLKLLGVDPERLLFVDRPTKFRTVYVPDQSIYFFESFHGEFLKPYDMMLRNLSTKSNQKKIYLSRSRLRVPDCINEKYFEEFYSARGFAIIHPQELSFEDQVATIYNAEYIVSTVGTLTHLAVFAKRGARLVGLMRASDFIPKIQFSIDKLRGLNSTYIDVSCNFLPSHRLFQSLYIGPNENWRGFVRDEYGLTIMGNIFDYINQSGSDFGLYVEQWLRSCSNERTAKYIKNRSTADLVNSIRRAERSYFEQ